MLVELHVRDLGVIADLGLVLGPGMTALTGETGAGKTLLVDAIELLLGGRGDPVLVRPGATAAAVEGRFHADGEGAELILARTVPASGRTRAYVDGRMATVAELSAAGEGLADLHGQHDHQSLLRPAMQRAGLDAFAAVDHAPRQAAVRRVAAITDALGALGGDDRARARELDLLRFQVEELERAALEDPEEEERLVFEEDRLADATAHREGAAAAAEALTGEGGVVDGAGVAVAALAGREPLSGPHQRLRALAAEAADVAAELRAAAESLEDDPERLAEVRARRALLRDLRRKYGETLTDVLDFARGAAVRLEELAGSEHRAAALQDELTQAQVAVAEAEAGVGRARRAAAPKLATAVERQLHRLAMPRARFEVRVGEDRAGDEVTWSLGANPGEPVLPLTRVASGGELARTMLAVRLVLGGGSGRDGALVQTRDGRSAGEDASARTLVFDEVDAGIGGEAAVAVGRALAELTRHHQVLVVTHLPQVAAFAHHQIAVRKREQGGRTVATVEHLDRDARVVELARMLSGRPGSATARRHAEELLAAAGAHPT
jgi:DNA repair protein RecN (Recombination protein N)